MWKVCDEDKACLNFSDLVGGSDRIDVYAHLADTLARWVHEFEYERLVALVAPEA
jgi:hypothetical protein